VWPEDPDSGAQSLTDLKIGVERTTLLLENIGHELATIATFVCRQFSRQQASIPETVQKKHRLW
jgi:hypothetical protein